MDESQRDDVATARDARQIFIPDMCALHRRLLLAQVGIGRDGPWRSAVIAAQIALFQGTTAHPQTPERVGGDLSRLREVGCLACFRPDTFGLVVEAFQKGGIAATIALGERLVREAGHGVSLSSEP